MKTLVPKQNRIILYHTISIFAIVLLFISAILSPLCNATNGTDETTFSIIWISDTQHLTKDNPGYFDKLCAWIVENSEPYNIKMVVHTGDIVSEGKRKQWINANKSIGILLDNGIPYCWNAGNHDYIDDPWVGNDYAAFNPEVIEEKSYWIDDEGNGMNTAVHFNISSWDCLIINLAYHANTTALDWAENLLDTYPQSHAIIATHAYLDKYGGYDSWGNNFRKILDNHANVFLTLNGHSHPTSGNWLRVGQRDELLFDMQDEYNEMGAASARILTFNTAKGTIAVQTYSVYLNQYLEDIKSNFIINTSFRNNSAGQNSTTTSLIISVTALLVVILLLFLSRKIKKPF